LEADSVVGSQQERVAPLERDSEIAQPTTTIVIIIIAINAYYY
jgi:hypothetical protein